VEQPIARTAAEALVETLRDEVVRGDLVPGQYLRLEEIAARFDVGTMPVRQDLRDLEAEGLVSSSRHRGAMVTQLSADELQDIYDIRVMLEEVVTRSAVPRMTESTLAELASLLEQMEEQAAAIMRDHVAQVGRALVGYVRQRDESAATIETGQVSPAAKVNR
jgi:DNA-binding GntR family transcriptional regulator